MIKWNWQRTSAPAAPAAAVAAGAVVKRLFARLSRLPDEQQARLRLAATAELLLVTGAEADLPWVDGIAYAAPSAAAPQLWLPLQWQPDVPLDLLAAALRERHRHQPLLLWHAPAAVMPLNQLYPLDALTLARLAELRRELVA
ncbi:hypothetical protein SAMN02745857_00744 [Andreprevotia lacus DSM 23236]|jgi:hypothetical protein|uniref:MoxR-vWA-beta-propeller ternary system domain-containing protein n=1 Tax=Andreprevotia lacus DSM 23236 TaxID=1121001 RepID=A0A1W1X6M5_9NEIS|nr:hypothetical protein [Andreprevotia lacus]SMC19582.1 hypothetical protein SAMN02745857_00744 [Andreprevotia lacus DSM 23236]